MKNSQKGFITLFLIVILVIVIAGGVYLSRSTSGQPAPEAPTPVQPVPAAATPVPTQAQPAVSLSGWKTYTTGNVSIKYPGQLVVDDPGRKPWGDHSITFWSNKSGTVPNSAWSLSVSERGPSADESIQSALNVYKRLPDIKVQTTNVSISNISATKIKSISSKGTNINIIFQNGSVLYTLTGSFPKGDLLTEDMFTGFYGSFKLTR